MLKPRILVTGATGKTGSVVVAELLKAGYPVRAMVHREDGRSARLKKTPPPATGRSVAASSHPASYTFRKRADKLR
jgi:nucleoside-diphosphate-sugar epimerase